MFGEWSERAGAGQAFVFLGYEARERWVGIAPQRESQRLHELRALQLGGDRGGAQGAVVVAWLTRGHELVPGRRRLAAFGNLEAYARKPIAVAMQRLDRIPGQSSDGRGRRLLQPSGERARSTVYLDQNREHVFAQAERIGAKVRATAAGS